MSLKFTTKFIRSLGLLAIFLFAVLCIFASLFVKDLDSDSALNKFVQYTIGFENRFYDYRLREHLDPKWHSKEIALVDIDDQSLHKIGTWPIPREYHANLIDKLNHYGAKVIALDILYPEEAPKSNGNSPDDSLIKSFKNFQSDEKRILLAWTTGFSDRDSFQEVPPEMLDDALEIRSSVEINMRPYGIHKFTFPHKKFHDAQIGFGNISMAEDHDGFFRQYILALNVNSIYLGSLGFNAFRSYSNTHPVIRSDKNGQTFIELDNEQRVEINDRGETKIRYRAGANQFDRVPLWRVLSSSSHDEELVQRFKNKIVFVGSTALGAHDLRPSPIDNKMPGVLAHMNLTQMFLDNSFFRPANDSVKYSILILCLGMFLFVIVQTLNNALIDLGALIFILAGSYYLDSKYFFNQGFELKLFYCYFCFVSSYSWNTFLKFLDVSREKKEIKGTFSRYVAPTIVDEILKDPEKLLIGGIRKDITCLFSDVRDFTTISENLTAAELASSLNIYMSRMTDIVFDTKGTLDKYIGDAIVAFWGAPLEIGNHAQYAVEAAVAMIEALPKLNEEFIKQKRPLFDIGIGINSGECNVGNMGSNRIFSYTALGDNMNLGSRIESLCKYYGTKILISENTLLRLEKDKFLTRPIDKVIVKGKTSSVNIHEVLTKDHAFTKNPELLKDYMLGSSFFQQKSFKEAVEILEQLLKRVPEDFPTQRLLNLSRDYLIHPEKVTTDFDVTKMKEK